MDVFITCRLNLYPNKELSSNRDPVSRNRQELGEAGSASWRYVLVVKGTQLRVTGSSVFQEPKTIGQMFTYGSSNTTTKSRVKRQRLGVGE